MAERHRCRRHLAILAVLVFVLATGTGACTPNPPEGRVDDNGALADDQPGGTGATTASGDTTTVAPTTAAEGKPATNAGNICRGRADSFLPDAIAEYTVTASGDISGSLPPGAAGVQSAGASLVRRGSDNSEGLVSAVVFDEQPGLSAIVSSTIDLFLQAAGGQVDVTDTTVNGYQARTTTGPNGTSIIAWSECLNVWVVVQAPNAPMALDLAAKVHSP